MKSLAASAKLLFFFAVVLMGCNSANTKSEPKSPKQRASSEHQELSPKERYLADFGGWLDQVAAIVGPEDESLSVAIQELKKLDSKTEEIGSVAGELYKAAQGNPAAKSEIVSFLQDEITEQFGSKLNDVRLRLNKKLSEPRGKELRDTIGPMFYAATGGLPIQAIRTFLIHQSHPMDYAPGGLKSIAKRFDVAVDFRCVTPFYSYRNKACLVGDDGCHWRMQYSDAVLAAHVEHFSLEPADDSVECVARLFQDFPADWPNIKSRELKWYAWPLNSGETGDNYVWRTIMAIDEQDATLYFFWQCYDYGG